MVVLTFKQIMRLHHFCVQWDRTCSTSSAPLPGDEHVGLSQAGLV